MITFARIVILRIMGVIRKQSAYSAIFTYIGFVIGAINTLYLLTPKLGFFSLNEIGLTKVLQELTTLFSALGLMGVLSTFIRFQPFYKTYLPKEKNDLPFITVMVCCVGAILLTIGICVFENFFVHVFSEKSPLLVSYYYLSIPMSISFMGFALMESFAWMLEKSILANFAKEVGFRLCTLIIILLYSFGWVSIHTFFTLFSLIYVPAFFFMVYVVIKDGNIKLVTKISTVTKRLKGKLWQFTYFHFSSSIIAILPKVIEVMIIAGFLEGGLSLSAVYSIPLYLITVMEVPQRSMQGIGSAVISSAWKEKNIGRIQSTYRKSSVTLLTIGLFLFGVMFINMDNLIIFLHAPEYQIIKQLFLILALGKLLDLSMGLNTLILGYSKYWKYDFYISTFFVLFTVCITYLLGLKFGITGVAWGAAITAIGYNLMRFLCILFLVKIQPFDRQTFILLSVGTATILLGYYLPFIVNIFIDTFFRSCLFTIAFAGAVIHFKISTDVNELYEKLNKKIHSFLKK